MKTRKPRKDGRYIINVSFMDNELDLIEWADSQGSFSNYVKQLIREDMAGRRGQTPAIQQVNTNPTGLDVEALIKLIQSQQGAGANETVVTAEPVEPPKPKANKMKIQGIMSKRNEQGTE
jgi:hypothetical protein